MGGVPEQLLSHLVSQLALHAAEQRPLQAVLSESDAHLPSHSPEQSAEHPPLQFACQSKLPGLASHFALQSVTLQLPVHFASAWAVH